MIQLCRSLLTILAIPLLTSAPGLAQDLCQPSDTIATCWNRYNGDEEMDQAKSSAIEAAQATAATEVPKKATGVDSGGLNLASATKNFLPLLTFTGLLSESKEDSSGSTAVFDANLPFLNRQQRRNLKIRLLVDTDPQVSDAVKMALPESERESLTESLQKRLSDVDDYAVSLTYNWENATHGRSFRLYQDRFGALALAARQEVSTAAANAANDDLLALISRHQNLASKPFKDWDTTESEKRFALRNTESAAKAAADLDESFSIALQRAGLDKFAALVANQPQLYVEAKLRSREPAVGGDELSAKVTYEWSSINLNGALDGLSCRKPNQQAEKCLEAYSQYIGDHGQAIDRGLRVAFSGEYVDIDDQEIDLGDFEIDPILIQGSSKLILAFSTGWNWMGGGEMGEPTRFDFEAKWEDVSDDPMRQDRGIASFTMTKKFGDLSIPLGLVYANKTEFLTGVDRQLSAHIGLNFDFLSKKDQ